MRFKCFLLVIGLGLLFGPGARQTPLQLQPAAAGELAAPAGRSTNLDERWKQLTGGASVWRRAQVTDPLHQFIFDLAADRVQSTNGEITREQFLAMANRPAAARPAPAPAERPKPDERRPSTAVTASAADEPRGPDESGPVPGAEAEFRRRDVNGDGLLDYDEMDDGLRAERDRWDANKDGFIDLDEFKAYLRARRRLERETARGGKGTAAGSRAARPPRAAPADDDLPPNLPDWFREYDTDGDGQIGLYEWKAAGQPIARFQAMDNNGDGFLTPDEVLATLPAKGEPQLAQEPQQPPQNENAGAAERAALRSLRNAMMMEQVIQLNGKNGLIIRSGKGLQIGQ